MAATLTLDHVSMNGNAPEMARKGKGAAHYMRAVPAVLGSFAVDGICGTSMGDTSDASVVIGTDLDAPLCKRCAGIYARLVAADADTQDTSAPADADADETPDADADDVVNASVVVPGDVTESTPGNTDRVEAALRAARERAALAETGEREVTRADAARLSGDKPSANAEADAVRDAESGQAAKREGQAVAVARATDGKCAAEVSQEDGTTVLVTLSGRMALDRITPIAEAIGAEIIPVGKSAGALAPVPGSDTDGVEGVCPLCHEAVRLTNSGAVGTHRNGGVTPDAPQLSQREIPAVDRRGEPTRDAHKRREGEAYAQDCTVTLPGDAPVADQVAAVLAAVAGDENAPGVVKRVVPVVEHASAAPVGVRDHGRSDGVAMVPLGQSGYAGAKFDDGETFTVDGKSVKSVDGVKVKAPMVSDVVGGYFGYLTESEYLALSKNGRRNYRRKVSENRARHMAAKRAQRALAIDKGLAITGAERKEARERAALGSQVRGNGSRGAHKATPHTDVKVVTVGSDVVRSGR